MRYISTRGQAPVLSFEDAMLSGLARDGGLYVPETIPQFSAEDIRALHGLSYEETAFRVMRPFTGDSFTDETFGDLISRAYAGFGHAARAPLKQLAPGHFLLELFHGPTLAFKDVALQLLGRLLDHFLAKRGERAVIMGATSGDTGSAAIEGCRACDHVDIFILHPHNRVSEVQRRQMTSVLAPNVFNIAIEGNFDDCQEMVKDALTDKDLITKINFTSANSINISRWIPQTLYYFFAYKQIEKKKEDLIFSIPSGNFGNLFACLVSSGMGLPVKRIIASNNLNDTFTKFINSNKYKPSKSIRTISSAMDVGDPSNFVRVLEYFSNQGRGMKEFISAYSISDKETILGIKELEERYDYVCDPHGSVGYMGIKKHKELYDNFNYIFLETAHYSKFMEEMKDVVPSSLSYPERIKKILSEDGNSYKIRKYSELKDYINLTNS